MLLSQHDHVIQTFPPDGAHQPFRKSIGGSHQLHPMETLMLDASE
jgi:hypothetical protein